MFKFDFKIESETGDIPLENGEVSTECKGITVAEECSNKDWYKSEEIKPTEDILENIDICKLNSLSKDYKSVALRYMVSGFLLEDIKNNEGDEVTDLKKAEENHSDLIPAVYEGGAKIWECTDDLLMYFAENISTSEWKDKYVLDLGCGSGLLGIYAFNNGAKVTFHDYNKDVLENITIPNVVLNTLQQSDDDDEDIYDFEKLLEKTRYFSGDWEKWCSSQICDKLYDIIVTSETIYNPDNQQKLLNCLHDKLKVDGKVYVAAKTYYFGVGGGLRQFEQLIEKDKRFTFKSLWLSTEGVNREILELRKK
ncbi:histidine protein methyltransferase 1 homolog [Musca vetustissima]|uniref:histidine protein methyltransferase 1 homolog n=1 Tax=Musca vetustissima TaxID=27455 RepID=UPI002AB60F06|nr:histidine protein methyltransferase 1 homolog [Musca vetustissima]